MQETVNWNDLTKALAPKFEGQVVHIVWTGDTAELSLDAPQENRHRARGALHKYVNPSLIPFEGEDAWANAAVERYKRTLPGYENEDNS
ncbi:hypothetical protein AGMMS49975_18050 [Clostridia bacterium]|nr:hypothetical protein AGMMS49975_18050 [Clostridia bacterium]